MHGTTIKKTGRGYFIPPSNQFSTKNHVKLFHSNAEYLNKKTVYVDT